MATLIIELSSNFLTRISSTCFFHGLTQRWRGVLHQNFESLYLEYWKRYQGAVFKN